MQSCDGKRLLPKNAANQSICWSRRCTLDKLPKMGPTVIPSCCSLCSTQREVKLALTLGYLASLDLICWVSGAPVGMTLTLRKDVA